MRKVTITEAARSLGELIQTARSGEEVVIAGDHELLVRLVPVAQARKPRVFGSARGLVQMADDFETPVEGRRGS